MKDKNKNLTIPLFGDQLLPRIQLEGIWKKWWSNFPKKEA